MRKKANGLLLVISLLIYVVGFTDSFSYEEGFLVTQSSDILQPYKYIDFVGSSVDNSVSCYPQDDQTGLTKRCIDVLISHAKQRGADGIISLTWKFRYWVPSGWHSYVCQVTCQGMAIKRQISP